MNAAFRIGDRVRIPLGRKKIAGVIVEDRGALGVHGQHLYQVLVPMDPFEPTTYELPEEEIERAEATAERVEALDPIRSLAYLKNGGLIAILRSNISGGRDQPRAWLRLDSLGNVTHTFIEERGQIGGKTVPSRAVYEDHVFTPKLDEVLAFLRGFGLDENQASDVISSVGTSPRRTTTKR